MIQPVDERKNIEEQVARNLCLEIARAGYRPGDDLPDPDSMAQELVLNPRAVYAAYKTLVREGIIEETSEERYRITEYSPDRARRKLLSIFQKEMERTFSVLRSAGCSPQTIRDIIDSALDRKPGDNVHGQ